MTFNDQEIQKLKETAEIYTKAKQLIINAEELDKEYRTRIEVFDELRHAFDHLMRVISLKLNLRKDIENPEKYSSSNLSKLYGHVFRAGYDALDSLNISYFQNIKRLLDKYHREDIQLVLPEYYNEEEKIHKRLFEIKKLVGKYRYNKDIGSEDKSDFNGYIEAIKELDSFHELIIEREDQLISVRKKRIKEKFFSTPNIFSIIVFIFGTFFSIIGIILTIQSMSP